MSKKTVLLIIIIFVTMGLFSSIKNMLINSGLVYDPSEATDITYNALSENTKQIIKKDDVEYILNLEFQYQQKIGLVGMESDSNQEGKKPIQMGDDLNKYIIQEAARNGKQYSNDLIDEVLIAEETYLEKIGAIKK